MGKSKQPDTTNTTGEITGLLRIAGDDSSMADRLWELVCPELRRRAGYLVKNERTDHTLSATAVVNEAFVRLSSRSAQDWEDRSGDKAFKLAFRHLR